jgi:HEAT repeat protein
MSLNQFSPLIPFQGHPDPRLRKVAYCDLLESTHPKALEELLEALKKEQSLVVRSGIERRLNMKVRGMRPNQPDPMLEVFDKLGSKTSQDHLIEVFRAALEKGAWQCLPKMREFLKGVADPHLKACYLRLAGSLHFEQVEEISSFLNDPDPRIVILTSEILNSLGSSKTIARLIPLSNHKEPEVRRRVLSLLMGHGTTALGWILRETLLAIPSWKVHVGSVAVASACALRNRDGGRILGFLLQDQEPRVRDLACEGFKTVFEQVPSRMKTNLQRILKDLNQVDSEWYRALSSANQISIQEEVEPEVVHAKGCYLDPEKDPETLVSEIRAFSFGIESNERKLRSLMNYLYHPHPRVRETSLEWLGSGIPQPLLPILVPVLSDSDAAVRASTALILMSREDAAGLFDEEIWECLEDLVQGSEEESHLAIPILEKMDSQRAKVLLKKLIRTGDGSVAVEAQQTIESALTPEEVDSSEAFVSEGEAQRSKNLLFSNPVKYLDQLAQFLESGTGEEKISSLKRLLNYEVVPDPAETLILIRNSLRVEEDAKTLEYMIDAVGVLSFGDEWETLESFLEGENSSLSRSAARALSKLGDPRVLPHLSAIQERENLLETDWVILEESLVLLTKKRPDMALSLIERMIEEDSHQWNRVMKALEEWECPPTDLNRILISALDKKWEGKIVNFIFSFLSENGGRWDVVSLRKIRKKVSDKNLRKRIKDLETSLNMGFKPVTSPGSTSSGAMPRSKLVHLWWLLPVSTVGLILLGVGSFENFQKLLPRSGYRGIEESRLPSLEELNFFDPGGLKGRIILVDGLFRPVLGKLDWSVGLISKRLVYLRGKSSPRQSSRSRFKVRILEIGPLGTLYVQRLRKRKIPQS